MAAAADKVERHYDHDDGYLRRGREISAVSGQQEWRSDYYGKSEAQIIMEDAEYTKEKNTLDQEHVFADSVSKLDTFRGGTELN